ncbi:hypothetical protein D9M72_631810 [compost metagenome]
MFPASSLTSAPMGNVRFGSQWPLRHPDSTGIFNGSKICLSNLSSAATSTPATSPTNTPRSLCNVPASRRWVSNRSMRYSGSLISSINRMTPSASIS